MCRLCGREACAECFEQVKELTEDRPGAGQAEIAALQSRREKHAHSNPFFLSCTRRNEHQAKDFSPMSRFCKSELSQAITDMRALLSAPDENTVPVCDVIDPSLNGRSGVTATEVSTSASSPTNLPELYASNCTTDSSTVCTPPDSSVASSVTLKSAVDVNTQIDTSLGGSTSAPGLPGELIGELPSHLTQRFTEAELTDDVFRLLWAKGQPLVVTGLLNKFQIQWTPEYFIEKYNSQSCLIIECQTDVNRRVTVGDFFAMFGKYENRTECWKLKVLSYSPTVSHK
jgi:[histone H3]-dimethyl-L-lysine9 demethylase